MTEPREGEGRCPFCLGNYPIDNTFKLPTHPGLTGRNCPGKIAYLVHRDKQQFFCSFCGKSNKKVALLITTDDGASGTICNNCVLVAYDILDEYLP